MRVFHVATEEHVKNILTVGFNPPTQESRMFYFRDEVLGQRRQDVVSFGLGGVSMLPWVLMKTLEGYVNGGGKAPQMRVLECEVPERSAMNMTFAVVSGIPLGFTFEVTVPREEITQIRTWGVKEVLAMRPGHAFRRAIREFMRRRRALRPFMKETRVAASIPGLIFAAAMAVQASDDYNRKVAPLQAAILRRWLRKAKRLENPSEGFREALVYMERLFQAWESKDFAELYEVCCDFEERMEGPL